jgi:acetoin utilization deacetylase AcuC-like enzyme
VEVYKKVSTVVVWDDRFGIHDMGEAALYLPPGGIVEADLHIDNPARILRTRRVISAAGLDDVLTFGVPREVTLDELERVHSAEHIDRMQKVSEAGIGDAGGGYTPMYERSYELALLSTGSTLTAVDLVMSGKVENAHAMTRHSGHHASRDSGYGFCIFNNVAVAARAAQSIHDVDRVAIVDIDAHHGNGTEAVFYADPNVLTISIQQDRLFPVDTGHTSSLGERDGLGFNLNVNLPAGTGDGGYIYGFDQIVTPALRAFRPQLILVACGVDASYYDPMARLAVTARGFRALGRRLRDLARELCFGRLIMSQEGGYSHQYAPFCWLAIIEAIAEVSIEHEDPFEPFLEGAGAREITPWQKNAIDETTNTLEMYWKR